MADEQILAIQKARRGGFRFRRRLGGRIFRFRLAYNPRHQRWFLDLASTDGTQLVSGLACQVGTDLLGPFDDANLPDGQLFLLDSQGAGVEPTRYSFQDRVTFWFRPTADIASHVGLSTEIL